MWSHEANTVIINFMYNYLRRYRRRGMFTQAELAYLLGINCRLKVVRFERVQFLPKLRAVFAYQLIFNVPAHELFPPLYEEVSNGVTERALHLLERLKADSNKRHTQLKMRVLSDIIQRLKQRCTNNV